MAVEVVTLDQPDRLRELGVLEVAAARILRGEGLPFGEPVLAHGTPNYFKDFIRGEHAAAAFPLRAIKAGAVQVPDLWTGAAAQVQRGYTLPAQERLPYDMLPFLYPVESNGRRWWLIAYGPSGRLTHIFLPEDRLVICEPHTGGGQELADAVVSHLHDVPGGASPLTRIVGVVDLLLNSGHQLMNHLSGVERLLRFGDAGRLDEVWVAGTEFFPPFERLYPELAAKVRRFERRWDMHEALRSGGVLPLRLGTNIFDPGVAARVKANVPADRRIYRRREGAPVLAVTVRATGRRCVNLADVVGQTAAHLAQRYPGLGIVLDGWVIPDGATRARPRWWPRAGEDFQSRALQAEVQEASLIRKALPRGMPVRSLIGLNTSHSVQQLSGISAYLAHVGTLQHKIAFLTGAPGVVHGPAQQLTSPDSGHFQAEGSIAPRLLTPAAVRDVSEAQMRGAGFNDYEITDVGELLDAVDDALQQGMASRA